MKFQISKANYSILSLTLDQDEKIFAQHNKVKISWKSETIEKKVISRGKHKPLKQMLFLGKDQVFDVYSTKKNNETIAFVTKYSGEIKVLKILKNQPVIIKNQSLIAMTENIKITPHLKFNFFRKFFWHEDISLDKLEGEGLAFIEVDSSAIDYKLEEDQSITFNNSAIAIMDHTCRVQIEQTNIFKSIFIGDRIYRYQVFGPGKITMQNIPRNRE
jgi:uncharacterized protein (AIM24 family)